MELVLVFYVQSVLVRLGNDCGSFFVVDLRQKITYLMFPRKFPTPRHFCLYKNCYSGFTWLVTFHGIRRQRSVLCAQFLVSNRFSFITNLQRALGTFLVPITFYTFAFPCINNFQYFILFTSPQNILLFWSGCCNHVARW